MMTPVDKTTIDWTGGGPEDHGVSTAPREFRDHGDGRYALTTRGITLELDRIRPKWGELIGELAVRCDLPLARTIDHAGTISLADFNISTQRAREERAKLLGQRSGAEAVDWFSLLEEFCQRVLQAERTGLPAVLLRDVSRPAPDDHFEIDGLPFPRRHPVIVFGDGGALKSLLDLYWLGTLAQRGERVAYFDWEFDAADHRERLERLFGPEMPPVLYVRCERPLVDEIDRLQRIVQLNDLTYGVFDSVGYACGGPPESAEVASAYFRLIRRLRIGSLHTAHVNKQDNGDQKPFGSAFWHNSARATWFIKRSGETEDQQRVTVALYNRKSNIGPLLPPKGYEVTFGPDRTVVARVDLAGVEEFATSVGYKQRIIHLLKAGPQPEPVIISELGGKPESIHKAITRGLKPEAGLFVRVTGADGLSKIALVERRFT
jgi:hypothetical protein